MGKVTKVKFLRFEAQIIKYLEDVRYVTFAAKNLRRQKFFELVFG